MRSFSFVYINIIIIIIVTGVFSVVYEQIYDEVDDPKERLKRLSFVPLFLRKK